MVLADTETEMDSLDRQPLSDMGSRNFMGGGGGGKNFSGGGGGGGFFASKILG